MLLASLNIPKERLWRRPVAHRVRQRSSGGVRCKGGATLTQIGKLHHTVLRKVHVYVGWFVFVHMCIVFTLVTKKLRLFISQCMSCLLWRYSSPAAQSRIILSLWAKGSRCSRTECCGVLCRARSVERGVERRVDSLITRFTMLGRSGLSSGLSTFEWKEAVS
jgi:hypothetical protein